MPTKKVRSKLLEAIEKIKEEAIQSGDIDSLIELNKYEYVIKHGSDGRPYIINPYINFMRECLKKHQGGSLGKTQENMRKCAVEWSELPKESRKKYMGKSYKPGGVL